MLILSEQVHSLAGLMVQELGSSVAWSTSLPGSLLVSAWSRLPINSHSSASSSLHCAHLGFAVVCCSQLLLSKALETSENTRLSA